MAPTIAAVVCGLGIVALILSERGGESRTSPALWIAVAWLFIGASRMVSQWLMVGVELDSPDQLLEGSPLDRLILTGLLVAGVTVLVARGRRTGEILRRNWPIVAFFLYCLVSVLWSDFPFVAFKRWTKALGNLAMVLVVLTDSNPSAALKRFLAWTGFLLIPLSVLLIKYFPAYGRGYLSWVWTPINIGVATNKNGLGYDCLICGLPSLWRLVETFRSRVGAPRMRLYVVHGSMLVMVLWLFLMANSATALVSFALGGAVIVTLARSKRPATVHFLIATIGVIAVAFVTLDAGTYLVQALGRDPTLTGRTELWDEVLQMDTSPWFGAGFESFWLGSRADYFWDKYWWHPNQAHNGYLEIYLTLGWVGVGLLGLLLVSGYRNIVNVYRQDPAAGILRLAFFAAAIFYNFSEAAFKVMHPVWIAFLLAVTAPPGLPRREDDACAPAKATSTSPGHAGRMVLRGQQIGTSRASSRSWKHPRPTKLILR